MWGAIAAAAAGLATGVASGISAANERKKVYKTIQDAEAENKALYYNEGLADYTQRADSQNLLRNLRNNLQANQKRTRATAAVTGATAESQAAAKQAESQAIANTYATLGAQGQRYKDNITNRYLGMKNNLAGQYMNYYNGRAQSNENTMGNGLNLVSLGLGSFAK